MFIRRRRVGTEQLTISDEHHPHSYSPWSNGVVDMGGGWVACHLLSVPFVLWQRDVMARAYLWI